MQNIIQATKTLKSEMSATEASFSKSDSAMKRAAQRADLLRSAIDKQKEHVRQCADMVDKATQKYGEADTKTLKWKQALADAETQLAKLNGQLAQNNALTVWGQQVQVLGEKVSAFGQKVAEVGGQLTGAVTAPIVGAGVASVKMAAGFETSLAKVSTIADTTEVSMGDLEKSILDLSNSTGIGASDIAEATYQAISAGRDTADAVQFVGDASKLAKAGFTDVTTSVDTLTTIMNAYGLSADTATSISDKLIQTQNAGKTTVGQLGQSLGQVIPTAAAYGVNLDNVAAAYVAMTKNGVSTAESTTYLNGMINELGKSGTKASDILKEKTGKSFKECMESGMSFADVLGYVIEGAKESGVELNDMFGNARAGRAAMNIAANGGKEFAKALKSMSSAAGSTDTAFEKVSNTTESKFNKAVNRVKNSGIEAGQSLLTEFAPAIEGAFNKVTEATTAFNSLSDAEKQNVTHWAMAAAAIGPVTMALGNVIKVGGNVISTVGTVAEKLGELSAAAEAAGGMSNLLTGFLGSTAVGAGLVIAPLAALGLAMWDAGEKIRANTEEQNAFAQKVAETGQAADAAAQQVDGVGTSIAQSSETINASGGTLEYYRGMLNNCYDAEGHLKEGMEQTAQYALNELNAAMGTDYSTEFVANAENSKQALEEINSAIDTNIEKLKEQAIAQAFQRDYTEALKGQTEAHSALTKAEDTYTKALDNAKSAQAELNAAMNESPREYSERVMRAKDAQLEANKALDEAASAYEKASGAAAEADSQVSGLEQTMNTLAEGTPESINQAAEAYGNVGTAAEEAGERARAATAETTAQGEADMEALRQTAVDNIHQIGAEPVKVTVDSEGANASAQTTVNSMQQTINKADLKPQIKAVGGASKAASTARKTMDQIVRPPLQGNINVVNGGNLAANTAKTGMDNIIRVPMQGNVNNINGWAAAANTAHGGMVPIIANPMQGNVNDIHGWASAAYSAHGGMVPIIANPMNGNVGSVSGAESAASSAWSTMQSIISRPLQAFVNITRTITEVLNPAKHASGGFVTNEQLSWLAEDNQPEVVIPLSLGKRTRALDLYKQTGAILGLSTNTAFLPALAGAGAGNTITGGLTVNVYGAEGQDEEELASMVIDKLQDMLEVK